MTETSINYAKALYELSVPEEAVLETEKIFRSTPQLKGALENPLVSLKEKEHVIDRRANTTAGEGWISPWETSRKSAADAALFALFGKGDGGDDL